LFFQKLQLAPHEKAAEAFDSLLNRLGEVTDLLQVLADETDLPKQKELATLLTKKVILLKADLTLFQQRTVFC
jgi:hypothetical protein